MDAPHARGSAADSRSPHLGPSEPTRRVGCCILNWNAGDALIDCVQALGRSSCDLHLDILVVDNASTDNSLATLAGRFPDIAVLQNGRNLGYAAGNNRGAAALMARGCDYLLFLNPDVRVMPDGIGLFIRALDRSPEAGWVGGASVDPSGQSTSGAIPKLPVAQQILVPMFTARLLRAIVPARALRKAKARRVENHAVSGACVLFRAADFRDIGGFDEATFLYREEYIVAERMRARGRTVAVLSEPTYCHVGGLSTRRIPLRGRLHFIDSEQHLLKAYLHWPWLGRQALRLLRYADFLVFAVSYVVAPAFTLDPLRPRRNLAGSVHADSVRHP